MRTRDALKDLLRIIMSLNLAVLWRIIRFGPSGFLGMIRRTFYAVNPFETKEAFQNSRPLQSIPVVPLGDIIGPKSVTVEVVVGRYEDGALPYKDALNLVSILAAQRPREVLEIGTFHGHTTRTMAHNLKDAVIHTVDLPPDYSVEEEGGTAPAKDDHHLIRKRVVGREFKGQACADRIRQYHADTASWDFRVDGRPTFFFIDGAHTYAYCKNDSEKCFALCGGKGTFVWHDCDDTHSGVVRLLCEWRAQGRNVVRIKDSSLAYFSSLT